MFIVRDQGNDVSHNVKHRCVNNVKQKARLF